MVSYSVNVTIATGKSKKESEGFFEMILVDFDDKVTNATSNVHGFVSFKNKNNFYILIIVEPLLENLKLVTHINSSFTRYHPEWDE